MSTGFRFQGEDLGEIFDVSGSTGIISANTNFTTNNIDIRYNFAPYLDNRANSTHFFKGTTDLNQLFQSGIKYYDIYYENMTTYDGAYDGISYTFYEATNNTSKLIYGFTPGLNAQDKTNNPSAQASILLLGGGAGGDRPNCNFHHHGSRGWTGVSGVTFWSNRLGGGGGAGAMGEATNYTLPINKLITSTVGNGGNSNSNGGASTLVIDGTTVATAYGGGSTHRISGQNLASGAGAPGASNASQSGQTCGMSTGGQHHSQVGNAGTTDVATYGSFTFYANRGGNGGSPYSTSSSAVSVASGGGGAGGVGGDRRIISNNYGYGGHGGSGRTWINGVTYAGGGGGTSNARGHGYDDGGLGGSGIGGAAGYNYILVMGGAVGYFTVNDSYQKFGNVRSGFDRKGQDAQGANRGSGGGGGIHYAQANEAGKGSAGITIYAIPKSVIKNTYTWNTATNPYLFATAKTTDNTVTTATYNGVQYNIYAFTSSTSNLVLDAPDSSITGVSGIHILLVGGGGAGGAIVHNGQWLLGGGGGAGGYGELGGSSGITLPTNTTISFTIGAGGDRSANYTQTLGGRNNTNDMRMYSGSSTRFEVDGTWIASAYGGVGAGQNTYTGSNGGSGAGKHGSMGNGTSHYGNSTGGLGGGTTNDTTYGSFTFWANAGGNAFYSAGGGGGAGGHGGNGSGGYGTYAGNGGSAKNWYINNLTYAGGGGGAKWARQGIPGGNGVGGGGVGGYGADVYFINNSNTSNLTNATTAGSGMANRGGGGGGRGCCGGAGGSGVALVAIPTANVGASDILL